jgi:FkbM family methyltransferase
MKQFILYDVGANVGADSLEKTSVSPQVFCHAFEPTPDLIEHLYFKSLPFGSRYKVHPIALSDFDGKADFHIAAHDDWGVSSLNEFSEGTDLTWSGRKDLYFDKTCKVNVFRLETMFRATALPVVEIDYFHCDVQGSDLRVLKGMGDFICLIKEGVIEVPQSEKVKLYKNQHTKEESLEFLHDKGFEPFSIMSQMNEDNIYFRRRTG